MAEALLPPNATPAERAAAEAVGAALTLDVPLRDLWRPETCPAAALPQLAWALSVDVWDPDWPDSVKRATIADSLAAHRIKGTPASIRRMLGVLGLGEATITEGIVGARHDGSAAYDGAESYGEPAHWASYRVYPVRPITNGQADLVRRVLSVFAPARCELAELDFVEAPLLYDGAAIHDGAFNHGVA